MAKAPAFDPTSAMTGLVPPEAIRDYCDQTVKKAAELSRTLINSVSQAVNGSFDLSGKLIRCNDPAEVMSVYKDWLTERRDAMLADGKDLASQWLKLCEIDLALVTSAARRASEPTNVAPMSRAAAAGD